MNEPKHVLEKRFVEAGLYRLCHCDTRGDLIEKHRSVYHALCEAAKKLNREQLEVLSAAFDGVSYEGESLE